MHAFAARAGALFFWLVIAACGVEQTPPEAHGMLIVGTDTFRLPEGARVHDVAVRRNTGPGGEFAPRDVDARQGDALRFTALDAGSHALSFDASGQAARAFLDETGQLHSPPLLHAGAAWIISLADAPAGLYPVVCLTHSDTARVNVHER